MSEVLGIDETLLQILSWALLAVALTFTGYVLTRSDDWQRLLAGPRERFVFGIPWGTVIIIVLVVAVYYLLQGGGREGGPIVTGFRSWSLWYPQGTLFSSFAHSSESHLTGNMFGTLAFAPLAEYAWRHYPDETERDSLPDRLGNPYARIGIFVGAVVLVGILGAVIVPGAVIGFSGLVFAFAGFAIIAKPIATVLAIVAIQVIRLLYRAATDPFIIARSQEQFVRPSWADIAVQGHLYGLLVGIVLAVALLQYRDERPNIYHVFFAALVFAVTRSLQSIYWFLGGETYVLFTAIGAAGVFVLATVTAVAAMRSDRMLVSRLDLRVGTAAIGVLLAILCALAVIGVPYNLVSVTGGEETADGIEVEDYTVTYAEGVEDQYIAALDLPFYQGPSVQMSGVIVVSEQRNSWEVATSAQRLESQGSSTVVLGDATWRETVDIQRTEWEVIGGNSTYKVFGNHDGEWQRLFASEPATAEIIINDSRVRIQPADDFYEIMLERNGEQVGIERIPSDGDSVTISDVQFVREGNALIASHEQTAVQVAQFES